jgi:hypothetical protein
VRHGGQRTGQVGQRGRPADQVDLAGAGQLLGDRQQVGRLLPLVELLDRGVYGRVGLAIEVMS